MARDRATTITPSSNTTSGTSTPSTESSLMLSDILEPASPFEDLFGSTSSPQLGAPQQTAQLSPVKPPQDLPPIMSAPVTLRSFSGETDDNVQPGEFLKTFRHFTTSARITDDDLIITSFGDHLKYGSPADDWFAELTSTKQTWKEVETAFLQRFPPVEKAKRTETELERELCELRLKTEDLGKKEKYAGEEVYTHVIFAEKALSLAKQAKISTGSNSIWKVRDELPDIIRQKVKETYPTWTEFCAAIKGVEMAHIRDGVKKYQKEKEEKEKTEAAIASLQRLHLQGQRRLPAAPTSSVSNISQTQQSSTLGGQRNNTPQSNSTNTNAYTGPSSGQGNLPRPAPSPITEAD
ncbi:uncharacterized protein LACBIDRAFT_314456 [Laccaria bicolor S238N-H82]|uniref:Predicted protein n=1 Tax=Laccaria bicolor (strain S238N-H82 / ATCC MYA-4686) TaxID=486041 RepID=B0DYL4_LACBS|nr:uncharacterized protein LACBIDRAFT_314456 [Laccaria bicolor S238N-H82]EDR00264.1 predicted protein [Laccaria bicolor S238N-H82]|eukprot:XP_001889016.1 predicted protein [Laccaria bicolor S238N-H82]